MIDSTTYLGPATVRACEAGGNSVEVELPEGDRLRARLALSLPYQPAVGDEVVVVGSEPERCYVVGVLRGSGEWTLRTSGSMRIEAQAGLTIASPAGVRIESADSIEASAPQVTLRAGRIDTIAHRVVQKAREVYGWVSGLFELRTHRFKATAEADLNLKGERAYLRAKDTVNVNGQSIHLG